MMKDKGKMSYYLTQNIDNLEENAGFKSNEIYQAHGANFGAHCHWCDVEKDRKKLEEHISKGDVYYCEANPDDEDKEKPSGKCTKPIKPNITFFGEQLPERFMKLYAELETKDIDLMIVMGTALAVGPFN